MAFKEGERFLSDKKGALHAFEEVNLWHLSVDPTRENVMALPPEKLLPMVGDYVGAAVAYFANRSSDHHLEEVGTVSWQALQGNDVEPIYTDDARRFAMQVGAPLAAAMSLVPEHPNFLYVYYVKNPIVRHKGAVTIPPDFVVDAKIRPIVALTHMAYVFSCVRDYMNGRYPSNDPFIDERASATQAQFSLEVASDFPFLTLPVEAQEALIRYPSGIESLSKEAMYKGVRVMRGDPIRN